MDSTKTLQAANGPSVSELGLKAQAGLLPYALLAFGITLPIFAWAGGHAANASWMSGSFAAFGIAWAAFYAAVNWLKTPAAADLHRRARVQILGGLIWAAAIAQVTAFAEGAGPARETLLLLALSAAMICVIFTAPWLPSLLIVAPAALAAPLAALFSRPADNDLARLALGASALALALALLVNRILRSQYALAAERESLIAESARQADAARRLAAAKSDLVATLSDEVRSGLTGVAHVLAAAAGRSGRGAPSRQQLAAALGAVDDLLTVLNTTVDAEAAEAGRLTFRPAPFDPAVLARELVLQHRPDAAAKGLELAVHVEPEVRGGAAVADPARVRQALSALLSNAVRYTLRGRVEVRLSRIGEDRLAIEVADTGPGLSDAELELALQPFRRVPRTSAGAPGAGLGLPLARELARLMGGELTMRSAVGLGSRFVLQLPYDVTAVADEAGAGPPIDACEPRRLRVLLVEPDALTAAMLRASLEQLGHQVVQAADGRRAVELARMCDLDLAVAAVRAPGPDAQPVIAALRRLDGAAGCIPLVAVIGGDPEEASEALAAGAEALLRKPASVAGAARAIAQALGAGPAANDRAVA